MPEIFLREEMSPLLNFIVNGGNLFAWLIGGLQDTEIMKNRFKLAYSGAFTDVACYDEMSHQHYNYIATNLLDGLDLKGMRVLDVGCGTGIVSSQIIERGATSLVSGDQSEFMLNQWKKKAAGNKKVEFHLLDAENLPFPNGEFDVVVSSMVMGQIPNQLKCLSEMRRVLKPDGILAISTHGTRHYLNILEINLMVCIKKAMWELIGYRPEYWPWNEKISYKYLDKSGFKDQKVRRLTWVDEFGLPEKAWQFYSSTTGLWWCERFSKEKSKLIEQITLDEMKRKKITNVIMDVVFWTYPTIVDKSLSCKFKFFHFAWRSVANGRMNTLSIIKLFNIRKDALSCLGSIPIIMVEDVLFL